MFTCGHRGIFVWCIVGFVRWANCMACVGVQFAVAGHVGHNGCDGVSNNQPHHCLLNHLFGRRAKETLKLHVICLCAGNSPVTDEFPVLMASKSENVSIWWCHHPVVDFIPLILRLASKLWDPVQFWRPYICIEFHDSCHILIETNYSRHASYICGACVHLII